MPRYEIVEPPKWSLLTRIWCEQVMNPATPNRAIVIACCQINRVAAMCEGTGVKTKDCFAFDDALEFVERKLMSIADPQLSYSTKQDHVEAIVKLAHEFDEYRERLKIQREKQQQAAGEAGQ